MSAIFPAVVLMLHVNRWLGELHGAIGFVPSAYVEHHPMQEGAVSKGRWALSTELSLQQPRRLRVFAQGTGFAANAATQLRC